MRNALPEYKNIAVTGIEPLPRTHKPVFVFGLPEREPFDCTVVVMVTVGKYRHQMQFYLVVSIGIFTISCFPHFC